jgi:flavin reductase (DIM6/NTAB) family NADH-FMN oxidoreductase RutF
MTMGLHMMMQHEPALIGVVLGPWDHTLSALQESGECVIAVPTIDLAQTVVDVGNCSGAQLDKVETFGLTAMLSRHVRAPSVRECDRAQVAARERRLQQIRRVQCRQLWAPRSAIAAAPGL